MSLCFVFLVRAMLSPSIPRYTRLHIPQRIGHIVSPKGIQSAYILYFLRILTTYLYVHLQAGGSVQEWAASITSHLNLPGDVEARVQPLRKGNSGPEGTQLALLRLGSRKGRRQCDWEQYADELTKATETAPPN